MRVAVPVLDGLLSSHFGGSPAVALFDVDPVTKKILSRLDLPMPPHQPGLLPVWLKDQGTQVVICGGIGGRAQAIFAQAGIQLVAGAAPDKPETIVTAWLDGRLENSPKPCNHDHHHDCHH